MSCSRQPGKNTCHPRIGARCSGCRSKEGNGAGGARVSHWPRPQDSRAVPRMRKDPRSSGGTAHPNLEGGPAPTHAPLTPPQRKKTPMR
eukprot:15175522-Alexandrium_andersonii.AAC.1